MPENKKHISNADFQRYLKNEMTDSERNAFEREMQKQPFDAEALEGMQQFDVAEIQNDLNKLHAQIPHTNKKRNTRIWAAAASVLLLISAGIIWFQLGEQTPVQEMAETENVLPQKEDTAREMQTVEKRRPESESSKVTEKIVESDTADKFIIAKEPKSKSAPVQKTAPADNVRSRVGAQAIENQGIEAKNFAATKKIHKKEIETPADSEAKREGIKSEKQMLTRQENSTTVSSEQQENFAQLAKTFDSEPTNQKLVKGKTISLDDSLPLPGVSIIVKGTSNGTISDINGNFTLGLTDNNDSVLVASFVGMENNEFYPSSDSMIVVGLEPSQLALDEVVVVGYGSREESELTGSISRAKKTESSPEAQPVNGIANFKKYVKENAVLPDNYQQNKVVVRLGIKIDTQGKIVSFENKNEAEQSWFKKAKELITSGPEWNPKTINGTPVESEVTIRIVFKKKNTSE